jgi:tight adherence protein B
MFKPARGEQIAWLQGCGAMAFAALYGFLPYWPLIVAAILVLISPPIIITVAVARRRKQIDDQTHGFALALSNALKTTASIGDALWVTVTVSANPLKEEVETALKQVRIGSTLEEALLAMSARAGAPALDVVVSALLIGRQMGGDLPRILDGTAASLRELKRLEELTARVTASAKQSLTVAAMLVAGLAFTLPRFMPGFFDPLRDTVKGQVVAAQCAVVYLLALYLGYRFTRTDI